MSTVIIEKGKVWGGSSALSGGGLWIPNNHVSKKAGLKDSEEEALEYMQEVIEDSGPASTYERKVAYIKYGHRMVKFLEDLGNGQTKSDKLNCNCKFYEGLIQHFIELMVKKRISGGNFTDDEKAYIEGILNEY